MLCYAMLCYVMLCYAMLCYVMLCYAMLIKWFSILLRNEAEKSLGTQMTGCKSPRTKQR